MDMPKKFLYTYIVLLCSCIYAQPTHVFVKNCTPLQFDVSIEYQGVANEQNNLRPEKDIIHPFAIPEEKNMLLAIPRELPTGEHRYTIKLTSGLETISLKQKCISQSPYLESELGLSLESFCLNDPWFMNNQAKQRHEHFLYINNHTVIIVYYSYDTKMGEDVDYVLYEKLDNSFQPKQFSSPCQKMIRYGLAVPIFSAKIKKIKQSLPLSSTPFSLHAITKKSRYTENKQQDCGDSTESKSLIEQTETSLSLLYNIKDMQSLYFLEDEEKSITTHTHPPLIVTHTKFNEYSSEQENLSMPIEQEKIHI